MKPLLRLCLSALLFTSIAGSAWAVDKAPNVLFFLADDCSYPDLELYGGPAKTPNLNKLAKGGMTFNRCYQAASMCSPTRHCLYTGLYPVRSGAYPNHARAYENVRSIPHYLSESGYRVALAGKTHIEPKTVFPFEYLKEFADPITEEVQEVNGWRYPNIFRMLQESVSGQPVCLFLCSNEPHGPFTKGDSKPYENAQLSPQQLEHHRESYAKYLAEVTYFDGQVGEVMRMLETLNLRENTLVFAATEQGSSYPFGKWTCYEVGVASGLVVSWPGIVPPASKSDAIVEYVDIVPTILDAVGAEIPDSLDGRSFLPVLKGKKNRHKEYAYSLQTTVGVNGVKQAYGIRSVVNEKYRLVLNLFPENEFSIPTSRRLTEETSTMGDPERLFASRFAKRPKWELFDVANDLYCEHNLAKNPEYRPQKNLLTNALEEWMVSQNDLGRRTELAAEQRQAEWKQAQYRQRDREKATASPQAVVPTPSPLQAPAIEPPANSRKPNVLFLAIDDLRPELGAYGSKVKTPNMDRLASSGMLFQRAYCQQAVCGASRVSIMSGLYPTLTGEQTFHVDGWRDRHPNLKTMNQHFREQGFRTLGMGKIYHGHTGAGVDPMNWDQWINVKDPGHYASQESREQLRKAIEEGKVGSPRDPPKGPMTESADVHDDTYVDGKRAARAVEVIKQLSQGKDKPFFLAVGLSKPHLPFVAPTKYWNLYQRASFRMPSNVGIPPGYPIFAANQSAPEMKKYSDFEGQGPKDFSSATNKRLLHGYAAATSYVDACIGRILDSLDRNGLSENTIVVLWGDHGWKLGDHSSWCKHTNFECDTRVPLIVRDPRIKAGRTPRLVELIDLYPTLCDLTGIPTPEHCQGRSFRAILEDPEAGHRLDAYSSYPALKLMGHSIHHKHYRYTEWRDKKNQTVSSVLTDLSVDPGEVTNVQNEPKYAEALALVRERLEERIKQAAYSSYPKEAPVGAPAPTGNSINRQSLLVDPSPQKLRQPIDGFGGSIAFWGTNPDDEAMKIAFQELKTTILRVQGEVSRKGITDKNREVLQRAMKLNPKLEVMLTFWQPRSAGLLEISDWLDVVEEEGGKKYVLKPYMEEKWAEEIVKRTKLYLDWGINVKTLGVQNETNYSQIGTQTCIWDPLRLKSFLENHLKPRLDRARLKVEITAPDLAYVGYKGSEVERFLPTIASNSVDLVAYHMYDSYKEDMDGSLSVLQENSRQIGKIRRENFPGKRFWMTETTGAQWNNDVWHTYGWKPNLTEYDKALLAAQYMHMTFADAGANAFMWWGLVYSLAPEKETNPKVRQKHRDEGLVLVAEKTGANGRQKLLERTKKFFFFKQFSNFILPGYRRVAVSSNETLWNTAYRSPDGNTLVVVTINTSGKQQVLEPKVPGQPVALSAYQTDRSKNCERVGPESPIPPKSVRTFIIKY